MLLLLLACALSPVTAALPDPPLPFHLQPFGDVPHPTAIATGPDGALFVTEQEGRIWRLTGGAPEQVGDLSAALEAGGEKGLLGLALHPRWPEDPRIFVNYTYKAEGKLRTRIASYTMPAGGRVDPASMVEILSFAQPWENHNSGALAFGPDGYLYAGVGDGGSGGDPKVTGQDPTDLLGSLLRLDISVVPYRVPPDNPFLGKPGIRPELWAYGVRNPWGMHFDGATLWFADVGQNTYEEIDKGVAGANYGWSRAEGLHCFNAPTCDRSAFTEPVAEYDHLIGGSVTGGVVYRGPSIPELDGRYLYADYATAVIFALPTEGGSPKLLGRLPIHPSTFGVDSAGNVYIGDYGGSVQRIVP